MSSSVSGLSPISTYLSIIKNEQAQVASTLKTDPTEQRTVAAFQADTVSISSAVDLLDSKNQLGLQVVLGAYNMSGESTETGLLRKLITQDPSVSGSLVKSLGSADDLHFVKALTDRATIAMDFGDATAESFSGSGSKASSITLDNLAWDTADSSLTAASPAETFAYVIDDGTAAASVAASLTTALQATGTTADPVTGSYSVNASGAIVGTSGAPAISISTDTSGNNVYSLVLASNSAGAAIRLAHVVAVNAPAAVSGSAGITAAVATPLLSAAMAATGFNVVANGSSGISILNPIDNGVLSLSPQSYSNYAGLTPQAITASQTVLPLGVTGLGLTAGQVIMSGGDAIGTVKSVDMLGNVTLTAGSAIAVATGARIDVAIGAGIANIGTVITATAAAATTDTTLSLGTAAAGIEAGQVITDGSVVLGIVKSVSASGLVTMQASLGGAVAVGDTLTVLPKISDGETSALSDASNVKTIISQYETSQYETQESNQIAGMGDALYFTRTMPTITSITQLMSDTRLLNVVTTDLGLSDTYDQLPFDQQVSLLTSKVNLSDYSNPAKLDQAAEQFLVLNDEQTSGSGSSDPALLILTGGTSTADGLLAALYPSSSSSNDGVDPILSALYVSA